MNPSFPPEWQPLVTDSAEKLRKLALDEDVKARVQDDPLLKPLFWRIAKRYVAGETAGDAVERAADAKVRGHAATVDYMGESCRDEKAAGAETEAFLSLIEALNERGIRGSVSLDISHLGSLISPDLGFENTKRIAEAAAAGDREVMISMEGSDRTDTTLDTFYRFYEDLSSEFDNLGITVQARLHRTEGDLLRLLERLGRIRLVKGAYHESTSIAFARGSEELARAYRGYATTLLRSGHRCSIATHDRSIHFDLIDMIRRESLREHPYEFECLFGLGTEQIDDLNRQGHPTREYIVYGSEWFLYVLNRIAEEPVRLHYAVNDLLSEPS